MDKIVSGRKLRIMPGILPSCTCVVFKFTTVLFIRIVNYDEFVNGINGSALADKWTVAKAAAETKLREAKSSFSKLVLGDALRNKVKGGKENVAPVHGGSLQNSLAVDPGNDVVGIIGTKRQSVSIDELWDIDQLFDESPQSEAHPRLTQAVLEERYGPGASERGRYTGKKIKTEDEAGWGRILNEVDASSTVGGSVTFGSCSTKSSSKTPSRMQAVDTLHVMRQVWIYILTCPTCLLIFPLRSVPASLPVSS